jgi:hypothetical protein
MDDGLEEADYQSRKGVRERKVKNLLSEVRISAVFFNPILNITIITEYGKIWSESAVPVNHRR